VKSIDEFREALETARAATRTTVVHIETDMFAPVPSSESWWDVPVSEVAELESTQQARTTYEQRKSTQRPFLRPSEQAGSPE
jgi:3D-(3,5/4)-trihydroxycyclohexane-1,2-dione acylhydrolase (decyclizing)